ncbi:hypothetical protein J0X14_14165 [Muricauda sp. CAU 1633]|uniref:hypothetical protein n=1 Tax=Allomuricauda sp. CAU 1633 TaxID=2816036 RepID=UPI001A8CEB24|nr:hypothetical protein [Muricauda sp. CAU 1633]MBO0323449.1 hypothetical protein [Muricauda sp. CAU 1633]
MTKIKEQWGDYSFREKVAIVIGTVGLGIQVFRYATDTLSENTSVEVFAFVACFLLMFAPYVIVKIIKAKKGLKDEE